MDDSLVSEGTRARQRAALQLAGVARFAPATASLDAAMALVRRDAPRGRARDAGERRLRDLNARSASLEVGRGVSPRGDARRRARGGTDGGARVSADVPLIEKSDTLEKWRGPNLGVGG